MSVNVSDEQTAEAIAKQKCTKDLCQRAGAKNLVVMDSAENVANGKQPSMSGPSQQLTPLATK